MISRDINKVAVDQVIYCCWCDSEGKIVDDGTITRLGENDYRWTAADPSLRWFQQNALGLDVQMEDISEKTAALALQGPTSGRLLLAAAEANIANLKYFRVTHGKIGGVPVDISRTGYTGDLGYEIWVPAGSSGEGLGPLDGERQAVRHPSSRHDCPRRRTHRSRPHLDRSGLHLQQKSPDSFAKIHAWQIGLGKLIDLKKESFVGRDALVAETKKGGAPRALVGLEIDWNEVEALFDKQGMAPQVPSMASRVAVPVFRGGRQVGKATSTTWSPTLKKMIALATVGREHSADSAPLCTWK